MQPFRRTGHIGMSAEAKAARRNTIGGSDAKIIMSGDQRAIEELWREKRGESEGPDFSEVLLVQLGNCTEALNLDFFEFNTGLVVTDEQKKVIHPTWPHAHATLDGIVRESLDGPPLGIIDAKYMLPYNEWTIEKALEKHWAQLQHNMACTETERAWLSVITSSGQHKWIDCRADFFYQVELFKAEKEFWEAVVNGHAPGVASAEANVPKAPVIRKVDMSTHNEWTVHAGYIVETLTSYELHELRRAEIKKLVPDDAAEAFGHGVSLRRDARGTLRFYIDGAKDAKKQAKAALAA